MLDIQVFPSAALRFTRYFVVNLQTPFIFILIITNLETNFGASNQKLLRF